jgi:hypothetical protein
MTPRSPQHAAALVAVERGWFVFPTLAGAKRPSATMTDWEHRASIDARRVDAWWARHPRDNPAIACGPSRLVVVDLDMPKAGQETPPQRWAEWAGHANGPAVFATLAARAGQALPIDTYTVTTPSGGRHLYFTAPELDGYEGQEVGVGSEVATSYLRGASRRARPVDQHLRLLRRPELRSTWGRLGWLVDTRAAGGYVLAAGAIVHGWAYVIEHDAFVAELPDWLTASLRAPLTPAPIPLGAPVQVADRYAAVALAGECERAASAPEGSRHWELNKAAWNLADGRLARSTVEAALQAAGEQAGRGTQEVAATIRSALNARRCRRSRGGAQ